MNRTNIFTDEDRDRLRQDYVLFREAGRLRELAVSMGRTVPFLSRQARELGLTDPNAPQLWNRKWKGMPESTARVMWDDFKRSSMGLGMYCRTKGYDALGFSRAMREHFGDEWEHVIEAKVPRQSMYRLGRQFEYSVRDQLKAFGYFVLRSPASRSPVDLVAIAPGVVLFVQCKRGAALGVNEWNELYDLADSVDAWPILAARTSSRTTGFWVMEDRKDGGRRRQPMRTVSPQDFLSEESAA